MATHGDEEPIRIARIDNDLRNLLRVVEAGQMGPRRAGVGGLVESVAGRQVRALESLAASDLKNVGV